MSRIEDHRLTSSEINNLLHHLPAFVGTFASDTLPIVSQRPAAFIVNTDPAHLSGEHWTAIVLKQNGKGIYFDPLGFPPLIADVQDYLSKQASQGFKYSCVTLQTPIRNNVRLLVRRFCHALESRRQSPPVSLFVQGERGPAQK